MSEMTAATGEHRLKLLFDRKHGSEIFHNTLRGYISQRCEVSFLNKKKPLDLSTLQGNDAFGVISPDKVWEEGEVSTVQNYVEHCGGILFVLTRHNRKPERLNQLLWPYGLSVNQVELKDESSAY